MHVLDVLSVLSRASAAGPLANFKMRISPSSMPMVAEAHSPTDNRKRESLKYSCGLIELAGPMTLAARIDYNMLAMNSTSTIHVKP